MAIKHTWKEHLLGCLEIFLLMPKARTRFGNTSEEALDSFFVPLFLFPLTFFALYAFPPAGLVDDTAKAIALLYSARLMISWFLFFGAVYFISKKIDRSAYFHQFIIAINWLSLPATMIFAPAAWMFLSGNYSMEELQLIITVLMFYTYGLTAFTTAWTLRIPIELAGFIAVISFYINNSTHDIVRWIGNII